MRWDQLSIVTIAPKGDTLAFDWPNHVAHIEVDRAGGHRRLWSAQIDQAVTGADRAVMIAAQGIGCLAATCWARLSPRDYVTRVASAVFVDPPSPAQDPARSAFASPLVPLPFASAVLSADGDRDEALDAMIRGWGSRPVAIARARRSRFPVLALLERFTSAVVEHDVQRILALQGHND